MPSFDLISTKEKIAIYRLVIPSNNPKEEKGLFSSPSNSGISLICSKQKGNCVTVRDKFLHRTHSVKSWLEHLHVSCPTPADDPEIHTKWSVLCDNYSYMDYLFAFPSLDTFYDLCGLNEPSFYTQMQTCFKSGLLALNKLTTNTDTIPLVSKYQVAFHKNHFEVVSQARSMEEVFEL